MTEEEYKKLCLTCDSILLSNDALLETVAIPWLHVVREHPIFLSQYEDLFLKKSFWMFLKYNFFDTLKKLSQTIRLIVNISKLKKNFWLGKLKNEEKFDVIFISHLLNVSQLNAEKDFYFDKVPHELLQQGYKVLIVLINQTSISGKILNNSFQNLIIPRVVISEYLPLKEEFSIWWCTKKQEIRFRKKAKIEKIEFIKKVLDRVKKESTSYATKRNLRIARAIDKVIRQTKANSVITTYEGHAWERLIYATVRSIKNEIKCIGYQHAALFRLQHSAKRSIGTLYDPEIILTAGLIGLNQMRSSNSFSGINFDVLGSKNCLKTSQKNLKHACLVLAEGILKEIQILFYFSYQCAKANPEIHFIWRLHPIINKNDLAKLSLNFKNIPSNIEISIQSFEKDIARSKWALYRGSTAIISATANGVIPIYLKLKNELTIDPLYEMKDSHPSIKHVDNFSSLMKASVVNPELKDYCAQFFKPIDASILVNKLKNIH